MKKHIRIIDPIIEAEHDLSGFQQLANSDLRISTVNLDFGPGTVGSQFEVALATPDVCAKAIEAQREGVDALVINCMGDVGCAEARECVDIPVLGPYESSLHIASLLSLKFGVVTMVDGVIGIMESAAKKYGAADKLGSIRAINMDVEEMHADPERRDRRLAEESLRMIKEEGVGAVILGCAEMRGAEQSISRYLQSEGIKVPIIEPMSATIMLAASLVEAGLSHSKHSFPTPQTNCIAGYDTLRELLKK